MTREEIFWRVQDILIYSGPDGHWDGAAEIADFIVSVVGGRGEEWFEVYIAEMEKIHGKRI